MFLQLDQQGALRGQLIRAMRAAILDGRYPAGARLPPSRELARDLGLSRATVLAAYDQLRAERCIVGKVGSGSYVAALPAAVAATAPSASCAQRQPSRYARRLDAIADFWAGRAARPARFNLQYGDAFTNPALTSLWSRELAHAARYTEPGYPQTPGLPALREAICDYLGRRRGVRAQPHDVLIVNGSQQALSLTAQILLDPGDAAVIEDPGHVGARRVFAAHGARVVGVRTDAEGLVCGELPANGARLVFATPSHQFPSGAVMSLARRLELLRYAEQHDGWVVEDDYDGEFRYDAQPLAALRSLDRLDRVIYVGTFSKTLFPMLRLGYMVMPAALRESFLAAKWMSDIASPAVEQAALAHFMATGGFERHLRQAAKVLKRRRAALLEGLRTHAGGRVEVVGAHAGVHLVVWLCDLDHQQCAQLIARAREAGVDLHSIEPHCLQRPARPGLLMGYAGVSAANLAQATRLFGQVLATFAPRA